MDLVYFWIMIFETLKHRKKKKRYLDNWTSEDHAIFFFTYKNITQAMVKAAPGAINFY